MSETDQDQPAGGPPTITVHHLATSRSQRVLWLLEELGVPYEVIRYERDPETLLAPLSLRKVHPLGKSPLITRDGAVMAETGLIVQDLCDRFDKGSLAPPGQAGVQTPERLKWLYWLHYAEGSAMPMLLLKLVFVRMPEAAPGFIRFLIRIISRKGQEDFVDPQLRLHLNYLEVQVGSTGWFAGPGFSAADVMMSFPIEAARQGFGFDFHSQWPNLQAFLDRIQARPAYRRALERGGPYAYA